MLATLLTCFLALPAAQSPQTPGTVGQELGLPHQLAPGPEFGLSLRALMDHGKRVFAGDLTLAEGQGRPLTKGTGAPLSDMQDPLVFPRDMNRVSGPDANSCAGCHNKPLVGGSGDFVLASN
jgi:hypothetical protein